VCNARWRPRGVRTVASARSAEGAGMATCTRCSGQWQSHPLARSTLLDDLIMVLGPPVELPDQATCRRLQPLWFGREFHRPHPGHRNGAEEKEVERGWCWDRRGRLTVTTDPSSWRPPGDWTTPVRSAHCAREQAATANGPNRRGHRPAGGWPLGNTFGESLMTRFGTRLRNAPARGVAWPTCA